MSILVILLVPLMVMGQFTPTRRPQNNHPNNISSEDTISFPFSTTAIVFPPTTQSPLRSTSRRFAFAFAARTTTTVLPPPQVNSAFTTLNRASLRFITTPVSNVTTTEVPLIIDDDTSQNEVRAFKGERLPLSTIVTTQLPLTTTLINRRPFNITIKPPSNRTLQRPLNDKMGLKQEKLPQTLQLTNKTTTIRPSNKNPIRIVTDNNNKTRPIHVQTELDPELTELRKRIAAGIAAQKLLRERLKQASASRLQTTNIQKVFTPSKARFNGVSRRKTAVAPKQSGVKTTFGDITAKHRVEGRLHRKALYIRTGRAGSPSPVISKRFHNEESAKQQVQVEPSNVLMEKFENNAISAAAKIFSAGPSTVIDDQNSIDNLQRTTKSESFHNQKDQPSNSLEIQSKPAFCRRCYRFWRNVSTAKVNKSAIYQYCCTIGSNKGELFKQLRRTTTI